MWRVIVVLAVVSLALWFGGQSAAAAEWSSPVGGASVALPFGIEYAGGVHRGIDLPADQGAAVSAPAAGRVTFAGTIPADGGGTCNAVTIETADGHRISLLPLESVHVQAGAAVCAGDTVGRLAASGDDSSESPHLHLGLRQGDRYIDPTPWLSVGWTVGEPVASAVAEASYQTPVNPAGPALPSVDGVASGESPQASVSAPHPGPAAAAISPRASSEPMTDSRTTPAHLGASLQADARGSSLGAGSAAPAAPDAARTTRLLCDAGVSESAVANPDSAHAGVAPGGTRWSSKRTGGLLAPAARTPVVSALVALVTAAGAVMPIIARSKALVRAR